MKSSGIVLIVLGVALLAFMGAANGCQLDEIVQVPVNRQVREVTGAPSKVSVKESKYVLAEYQRKYQAKLADLESEYKGGLDQFVEDIDRQTTVVAFGDSLISEGVALAIPAVGNLPGGAILSSLLIGAGGLLVGRRYPSKSAADRLWEEGRDDTLRIKDHV